MSRAPTRRLRATLQGLIAMSVGLGLFCLLLESVLRLAGYVPDDEPYGYDPGLLGDLQPDKRYVAGLRTAVYQGPTFSPYRLDTNSHGLRGDADIEVPKPSALRRILMLGDSFTFGAFLDNHETASAQLQDFLNRDSAAPVEVINAGMLGWTLVDQREYLREKGLRLEPDLVIVQFFVNDIAELTPHFRKLFGREHYRRQSTVPLFRLQLFLRRYSATYYLMRDLKNRFDVDRQLASRPDSTAWDCRPHWREYLDGVEQLDAYLRERDIGLLYVLTPECPGPDPWTADWSAWTQVSVDSVLHRLETADQLDANRILSSNYLLPLLRAELAQRSIPCVDLLAVFASLPEPSGVPKALYLVPQDRHISRFGNVILAQAVAVHIQRHTLLRH